jgi:hypothetical protein
MGRALSRASRLVAPGRGAGSSTLLVHAWRKLRSLRALYLLNSVRSCRTGPPPGAQSRSSASTTATSHTLSPTRPHEFELMADVLGIQPAA